MTVSAPEKKEKRISGAALRSKIAADPAWAMRNILGQKPWSKQIEMAEAVLTHRRVEVSGCVSSTKTYGAANIALLWLLRWGPGARVFSIAPSFRQVDTNIWGYIPRLVRSADGTGHRLGCEVKKIPRLEFPGGAYYEGFSTDRPCNVHGIHGPHDLLIIDDGQGIGRQLMDELENMMAGGTAHFLMLHNRVVLSGPSYDVAHRDAALWHHISISFWDMPNSDPDKKADWIPGALSLEAVKQWTAKYGRNSNFIRNKVDNEYPKAAPDTLIPLDWVESAFSRVASTAGPLMLGGDVARFGDDSSAKAPMRGRTVLPVTSWHAFDLMYTSGQFAADLRAETAEDPLTHVRKSAYAFIDVVGMGGGPVDRLVEQQIPNAYITGVDCGEDAENDVLHGDKVRPAKEVFVNKRSQMWWNLRECLDPAAKNPAKLISLPIDLELQAQLTEVKYRIVSDGRIEVEPKASRDTGLGTRWGLKQRLGHSPDKADAVVLAVWGAETGIQGPAMLPDTPKAQEDSVPNSSESSAFPVASSASVGDDGYMDGVES